MRLQKSYCNYQVALILGYQYQDMEYSASDASMLAEEILQIAEILQILSYQKCQKSRIICYAKDVENHSSSVEGF